VITAGQCRRATAKPRAGRRPAAPRGPCPCPQAVCRQSGRTARPAASGKPADRSRPIVRTHDSEGQDLAQIAHRIRTDQAAARRQRLKETLRLQSHPAQARARNGMLFARQWSASTCARAAKVFWQVVEAEGLDWISDVEVRRLAESRVREHSPETAQP
jgi:hypothetical protein